jgi:YfiH family protein
MAASGIRHAVSSALSGDMKDKERRGRALQEAGIDGPCLFLRQVHGTRIVCLGQKDEPPSPGAEADGWILHGSRPRAAGVFVADCVPLFVWHPSGRAVGLFHAGWRGMSAGMAGRAAQGFQALGFPAPELLASIGPHIGSCCFKVGPEVAAVFHPASVLKREEGLCVNLAGEARRQLLEAGLSSGSIVSSPDCTSCGRALFSYRRDKQDVRMAAFVMLGGGR